MQVTETNAEGLKHDFKVVVPAADIAAKSEARLKELSTQVKMPGFRPGKVPVSLMKKRYGSAVLGEVLEQSVQEAAEKTVAERELRPAMQPKIDIETFDEGKDLEFTMSVEVLPEITPVDFSTLELTRPKADVDDKEVEDALTRIAEGQKSSEPVASKARKVKNGDVAVIDFVGKKGGEEFEGGKAEDYSLEIGSGTFIPGFEDQVVGMKAGEEKVVTLTFPEDYPAEHLAGQEVTFDVTVKEIREPKVPEIDDELAKKVGMDDLEALKTAIREQIQGEYDKVARQKVKRELLDKLSDAHDFPVPQSMVDMEFDGIWKQVEQAKEQGNLDPEDEGKSDDELKDDYRKLAERRVRLGLLLSEVGQKNEIQVNQDDLNRAIMAEATRYPGQEQAVFQYFLQNQDAINQLRAPIYEDKVVDYILEVAKVEDKPVSVDELMKQDGEEAEGEGEDKPKKKAAAKKKAPAKKAAAKKADEAEAGEDEAGKDEGETSA
ncbi:Cell division trigger factor [Caenispirillum salinarum AK4]|uniref:Trigger factor n=1 Tax=Caenispirillum salinarum AK4 TaxID=1238182 RepID=K9H001_9PROT|nr:trigger factor [Caenispirillum salinarum]EKV30872.1 Cell division trigger factor [Caenispirillum salinarum AK4]